MTILDPVVASNLAVYLLQLPRSRLATRKQSSALPLEFTGLDQVITDGKALVHETSILERVRVENLSSRDIFIQASEVIRGGINDRAAAASLIVPAFRHEGTTLSLPTFCVEEERWGETYGGEKDFFVSGGLTVPGRKLKLALRLGTQDDVYRELAALNDTLRDIIGCNGTKATPPMSLWTLIEVMEAQGWFKDYIHPLLHLAEANTEATGVVFVLNGQFNSAELYATPALFRQTWPKLVWTMSVEALTKQRHLGSWKGKLPTKGEVTAWLAGAHGRRADCHTDIVTKRTHRRIRSVDGTISFETLDEEQSGLCVHETILSLG